MWFVYDLFEGKYLTQNERLYNDFPFGHFYYLYHHHQNPCEPPDYLHGTHKEIDLAMPVLIYFDHIWSVRFLCLKRVSPDLCLLALSNRTRWFVFFYHSDSSIARVHRVICPWCEIFIICLLGSKIIGLVRLCLRIVIFMVKRNILVDCYEFMATVVRIRQVGTISSDSSVLVW